MGVWQKLLFIPGFRFLFMQKLVSYTDDLIIVERKRDQALFSMALIPYAWQWRESGIWEIYAECFCYLRLQILANEESISTSARYSIHLRESIAWSACVQGSTNGTNGIPISFKVLPMVPLVIPLVPMVMPMVPLVSQWYHWLP